MSELFEPPKKVSYKDCNSSKLTQKQGHSDYARNLEMARNFIYRTKKSLYPGVKMYVADSHDLKESLLMICFNPPPEYPRGNEAVPIFLHKENLEFASEMEGYFNQIQKTAANVAVKIQESKK